MSDVIPTVLPWQQPVWQKLWIAKAANRLAHALLLIGAGSEFFAAAFAAALLCPRADAEGQRCQVCHSCVMYAAKTHPDCLVITPEAAGKKITVEQIRNVIKEANETTLKGGFRVVIINPAPAMNTHAANALLKTLEEPVAKTLFLLVADEGGRLTATIRSRCQKIVFNPPTETQALAWLQKTVTDEKMDLSHLLKIAEGSPFKALALWEQKILPMRTTLYQMFCALVQRATSPLQVAAKHVEVDALTLIDLLQSWLADMLRFKLTEQPVTILNVDYKNDIMKMSAAMVTPHLVDYYDYLQQVRGEVMTSVNLNKQLLFENIFIRWTQHVSR